VAQNIKTLKGATEFTYFKKQTFNRMSCNLTGRNSIESRLGMRLKNAAKHIKSTDQMDLI